MCNKYSDFNICGSWKGACIEARYNQELNKQRTATKEFKYNKDDSVIDYIVYRGAGCIQEQALYRARYNCKLSVGEEIILSPKNTRSVSLRSCNLKINENKLK